MTCVHAIDERYILTGGDDKIIKVWDLKNSLLVDELSSHKDTISYLHSTEDKK